MKTTSINILNLSVPCNNRCKYCLLSWEGKCLGIADERAMNYAKRFYSWLKKNCPELNFVYYFGYSMEHPKLFEVIDFLQETNSPGGKFLQFDGMKMRSNDELEELFIQLKNKGIQLIDFTFYGMEAYHDKFAGRKNDFDFLWIMDHLAIAVCFAATFIRLGNLFNSEIYGDVTSLPWGFVFELRGETEPKHPTQLYEALSYFLLGVFQILMYRFRLDKLYRGFFIGTFFIGCFGMRFLIEFIKEPQVGFEQGMALNMGQILSIPFVLLGIGLLVYSYMKKIPAAAVHPEKPKSQPTHFARAAK